MKKMGYNVKTNSVSQPNTNSTPAQPEKKKDRKPEESKPEKKF